MTTERKSPYLTAKQAGEYINYSSASVRRFARNGRLKFVRVDRGDYRFLKEWLDEFMQKSQPVVVRPSQSKQLQTVKTDKPSFLQERLAARRDRMTKRENR